MYNHLCSTRICSNCSIKQTPNGCSALKNRTAAASDRTLSHRQFLIAALLNATRC